ncbi:MAG: peptidogalycan biosysnthesis protein [Gaiellaceae bacterium]
MTFEAVVADPLEGELPAGWDRMPGVAGLPSLWGSGVLASLAWYERYRPLLALVQDASGEPCAAFCGRYVGAPAGRRSFHTPTRRQRAGFFEVHLPPTITMAGYGFRPELDVADRSAVLVAAERALGARLGRGCRGFAYRQVPADDVPAFRRGRRLVLTGSPDAVIENEWDSFDAYLDELPGEDRRELRRIRRIIDRDATLEVRTEDSVAPAEASRLAHVVRMRYRARLRVAPPLPSVYYDWLGRLEGVRFITYREVSGQLLAFGTLVDDGTTVRSLLWGTRERADGGRPNLYFDHFLREVEYCIAHGRRRLSMGKAMGEVKKRFGARPVTLYTAAGLRWLPALARTA